MEINRQSFLNLSLRFLSMGGRFLLIFFIGKYFSTEDLGLYGIFFTTVTLALFLIGFDFYTFSNREVLYAKEEDRLTLLRNQLIFYAITYAVFLLPLLLVFFYHVLPIPYIVLFYIILLLEHLSQEFYRLFTILSEPVFANWLLFLRSGSWIYALIVFYLITPSANRSLDVIFWAWVFGAGISVLVGFVKVFNLYKGYSLKPIKWHWFKTGLKVCSFYFLSTIALKTIEFANRYMIEYWCDLKSVGIFTFYSQIANMINVVIFTLFLMIIYPKLIVAVNAGDLVEYNRLKSLILKKVGIYSLILGVFTAVLIHPILYFINKEEYYTEIFTFYVLILSNIFLNISLVYHYVLYAFKKDRSLFVTTTVSALLSVGFNLIFIALFGVAGAAFALLLSYLTLALMKKIYAQRSELIFRSSASSKQ